MSKHDQHVRQIAEEMTALKLGVSIKEFKEIWDTDILHLRYLPAARIAVRHMADEVEAALIQCGWHQAGIQDYLAERGLIPTPERKEAGEV